MNDGRLSYVYICVSLINQVFVICSFTISRRLAQLCFTRVVVDSGDSCKCIIASLNRLVDWKFGFKSLFVDVQILCFRCFMQSGRLITAWVHIFVVFIVLWVSIKKTLEQFLVFEGGVIYWCADIFVKFLKSDYPFCLVDSIIRNFQSTMDAEDFLLSDQVYMMKINPLS